MHKRHKYPPKYTGNANTEVIANVQQFNINYNVMKHK